MNKLSFYILGMIFIFHGICGVLGYKILSKYDGLINVSIGEGYLYILIGVIFYYYAKKTKKKELEEKISICPKCEDSFEYDRLDEGRCKNCQDEKTIDIKEYYKKDKYPKE
jgi:predicted membrane channel-forming protein YqfA (hemolysin III family)